MTDPTTAEDRATRLDEIAPAELRKMRAVRRDALSAFYSLPQVSPAEHDIIEMALRDEDRLLSLVEQLQREHIEFSTELGFGDDKTEPALPLKHMIEFLQQWISEAQDHVSCPVICEGGCGERLADTPCDWCNGAGGRVANGGYEECSGCGGDRLVHVGCVGKTYAELVAERDAALSGLEAAQARLAERDSLIHDLYDEGECWFDHHGYCQEHGWFETDPACPHGRARALGLGEEGTDDA